MFYGRYDYPTGKFLWGNLRYQRVSEYNLQTFLNMKNSKLREEQIMSAKRDYYEVLGVSRDADKNTIKKAYRKLAKKYHPDTNQGNAQAAERFKEATEAYNILSDPEKKKMYDQFGHAAFDGSGAAGGAYGGAYSRNGGGTYQYAGPDGTFHEYHFEGNGDMDDFLKNIFGGSFGGFGGATRSSSKGSRSGFSVEVALEEVALAALVLVEVALEEAALVEVALAKVDRMEITARAEQMLQQKLQ